MEKTPIGGRSIARAAIAREPEGIWTTGGRLEGGSRQRTTGQVNASYTAFFSSDFEKMSIQESDVRKVIAEVQATSWRLRECIRVRELAATYRLGQMRRLRMLEEQKVCKREAGFDRIEITVEMDEQRLRTGFD